MYVGEGGGAENRRTERGTGFFLLMCMVKTWCVCVCVGVSVGVCVCVRLCAYAVVPVLCLNLSATLTLRSILQQWAGERESKREDSN